MKENISIPFPYVKLDKELNIIDYNSRYKEWSKGLKGVKTIFQLMSDFDVDKKKQMACVDGKYYDLYTNPESDCFNVIFVENSYVNNKGCVNSNILVGLLLVDNSLEIQRILQKYCDVPPCWGAWKMIKRENKTERINQYTLC